MRSMTRIPTIAIAIFLAAAACAETKPKEQGQTITPEYAEFIKIFAPLNERGAFINLFCGKSDSVMEAFKSNNMERVEDACTALLEKDFPPEQAVAMRGEARLLLGKYPHALEDFEEAVFEEKEFRAISLAHMGLCYMALGNPERAAELYEESVETHPTFIGYLGHGEAMRAKKEYARSLEDYGKALDMARDGISKMKGTKHYLGLADHVKSATEAVHNQILYSALRKRAETYRDMNEYDKALADLDEGIKLYPDPNAYTERGKIKYAKKDYEGAMEDLNTSVMLDPHPRSGLKYYLRGMARDALDWNIKHILADLETASKAGYKNADMLIEMVKKKRGTAE